MNPMNRAKLSNSERRVRADQLLIREPLALGVLHRRHKAVNVFHLAGIKSEHLFVNVGVKMERTRSDIGPVKRSLQSAPEILNGVRMNPAFAVCNGVVNKAVLIVGQIPVREQGIRIDRRPRENVGAHVGHQFRPLAPTNNHRFDAALAAPIALGHAKHHRLAFGRSVLHFAEPKARNHRGLLLAADERFVRLDLSVEHAVLGRSHRLTNAVKHKPCRLLGDTESASKLMRGRSVLRIGKKPNRREPFGKRNIRGLVDRADLGGKHPLALFATPGAARLNRLNVRGAAAHLGAGNSVRPAQPNRVLMGAGRVRKIDDGFLESSGRFHTPSIYLASATRVALSGEESISSWRE